METINVIYVEPGKEARTIEMKDELSEMQNLVGGLIEEYMPFEDDVAIICNDEGKMRGMPLNRGICSDDGTLIDIIAGPFFIAYAPVESERFLSMPKELEEKYTEKLYRAYITKGWGKSKIRFELRRKGLPDSLISQQEEEYDAEDFIDEIIHLVDKKYSSKLDFSDYKSVQRVTAALARRGFAYDDIKLALSRIKDGDYDEEEEYDD